VKMLLSFLQMSKTFLGFKNRSPVPENEIHSDIVEQSVEATTINYQSSPPEERKTNEELRETIYGNVIS